VRYNEVSRNAKLEDVLKTLLKYFTSDPNQSDSLVGNISYI